MLCFILTTVLSSFCLCAEERKIDLKIFIPKEGERLDLYINSGVYFEISEDRERR